MHAIVKPTLRLRRKQSGYALLMIVVLLVLGSVYALTLKLDTVALKQERDRKTALALARAKDALIGYAIKNASLPGGFPCPDKLNDGTAGASVGSNCSYYIGRLPWKTLGLADIRDGAGECLWYALAYQSVFRSSLPMTSRTSTDTYLRTDTHGTISLKDAAGNTLRTDIVAVIFSPGEPLSSQSRTTSAQTCGGTSGITSVPNDIASYLDLANATIPGPTTGDTYITAPRSASLNDTLIVITQHEFAVELARRIASELKGGISPTKPTNSGLDGYYATSPGQLPCAALPSSGIPTATPPGTTGGFPYAEVGLNFGQTPPPPSAPYTWLSSQNWNTQIGYSVASANPGCPIPGPAIVTITLPAPGSEPPFTFTMSFP